MKTLRHSLAAALTAALTTAVATALATLSSAMLAPAALAAPAAPATQAFAPQLIEQGRYLALASDCMACHTAAHGKPFAGGTAIASPVGNIIASNITPAPQHGIGNYTEQQFADALRKGIRADGSNLYPAMPYTAYAVLSDADVHALYAYFMQGVAPVEEATAQTSLPFPMNIRASMKIWNLLFLNNKPLTDDAQRPAAWNRGRYLAEGPAHCSTCHTPRGFLMQEDLSRPLTGAQVGPWFAPNITAHPIDGIGSWSQEELVTYLRSGRLAGKAQAAGSMAEAISHSFQYLTDADLQAIALYIKDRPAMASQPSSPASSSRFEQGQPGNALAAIRGVPLAPDAPEQVRGARIFSANCASCHGFNGQGTKDGYYPSLFHNSATAGGNPSNLLATILYGVDRETEKGGHVFMPPFGSQPNALNSLSDDDIAALGNYLLSSYGRADLHVSAADVAEVRRGGPQSKLLLLARLGMAFGLLCVLALAVWRWRRWRDRP